MAVYRPAVFASFPGEIVGGVQDLAFPFRGGVALNGYGQAVPGEACYSAHYSPAEWAYRVLGVSVDQGIFLSKGYNG